MLTCNYKSYICREKRDRWSKEYWLLIVNNTYVLYGRSVYSSKSSTKKSSCSAISFSGSNICHSSLDQPMMNLNANPVASSKLQGIIPHLFFLFNNFSTQELCPFLILLIFPCRVPDKNNCSMNSVNW